MSKPNIAWGGMVAEKESVNKGNVKAFDGVNDIIREERTICTVCNIICTCKTVCTMFYPLNNTVSKVCDFSLNNNNNNSISVKSNN